MLGGKSIREDKSSGGVTERAKDECRYGGAGRVIAE